MIRLFVLYAALWAPDADVVDTYALDQNLTGEDCIAALVAAYDAPQIEIAPGVWIDPAEAILSCEIQ
jgi:hypothetical protein